MVFKYNPPPGTQPAAAQPAAHPLPPPVAQAAPAATWTGAAPVAGLPPVQPPPAAQPAATQPATPAAPGRKRRGASQVAAAAPQAAPVAQAQPMQQAQVITQPAAAAPQMLALPANSWLVTFAPTPGGRSALDVVAAVAEQTGGEQNLFPTIELMGGTTGGMFDHDTMNEEGTNAHLPTGKVRMAGVLISFRYLFLLWPAGRKQGTKQRPMYRSTIAANQAEAAELLAAALKNFQMRTRPPKDSPEPRYDIPTGPGHLSAAVEALVFEPGLGLMCVRSAWTYDSFVNTNNNLKVAFPHGLGVPMPVWVENYTWQTDGSKGQPTGWPEHAIKFTPPTAGAVEPQLQNAAAVFSQFANQNAQDPELTSMLNEWAQHEMTPDQANTLNVIANMPRQ